MANRSKELRAETLRHPQDPGFAIGRYSNPGDVTYPLRCAGIECKTVRLRAVVYPQSSAQAKMFYLQPVPGKEKEMSLSMENQYQHLYYLVEIADQTFQLRCPWCGKEFEAHPGTVTCEACKQQSEAVLDVLIRKVENALDWELAARTLKSWEKLYSELIGKPGVNPWFTLGLLAGFQERLDRGERSQALYDDIMDLE